MRELNVLVEFLRDLHAMAGKIVAAQFDGLAEDGVHLHGLALRGPLARKTQQFLHDFLGALRLLQDDLQFFPGGFRHLRDFPAADP